MHDDYGNEVRLSYNNGMLETVTDPAGRVTRYESIWIPTFTRLSDQTELSHSIIFIWVLL